MHLGSRIARLFLGGTLLLTACSREGGPTTPAPVAMDVQLMPSSGQISAEVAALKARLRDAAATRPRGVEALAEDEEFNCQNVERVRVRFGPPGFVDGLEAGLFVEFDGMPAGEKILRLFWDLDRHPEIFQDVSIGEGDRREDDLFRFEDVITHQYAGVTSPTTFKVRAEMILEGETGNCARNRLVHVSPEAAGSGRVTSQTINTELVFPSAVCGTNVYRDVYAFRAPAGSSFSISVDTVSAGTSFDPAFAVFNDPPPPSIASTGFWFVDDTFVCSFPPSGGQCPSGSSTLPADADGVYYLSVFDFCSRASTTGGYRLDLSSNRPFSPLVTTEDNQPIS